MLKCPNQPQSQQVPTVFPACALTNSLSLPAFGTSSRSIPTKCIPSFASSACQVGSPNHPQHHADSSSVYSVYTSHIAAPLFGDAALHASQRAEPRQVPQNSPKSRSGSDPYMFLTFLLNMFFLSLSKTSDRKGYGLKADLVLRGNHDAFLNSCHRVSHTTNEYYQVENLVWYFDTEPFSKKG